MNGGNRCKFYLIIALFHVFCIDAALLGDIIGGLRTQLKSYLKKNLISINRNDVWLGARMGFGRTKFDPCAHLDVRYAAGQSLQGEDMSEGAVDLGGPLRELFTICYREMVKGPCFIGGLITRNAAGIYDTII